MTTSLIGRVIAVMLTCAAILPAHADDAALRAQVQARNSEWTQAAARHDVAALAARYASDATVMPEHNATRRGASDITDYLDQWWKQAGVSRWERRTDEIVVLSDAVVETGVFHQQLAPAGQAASEYRGKYLVVWRRSSTGLEAMAELWGADANFPREQLPAIATGSRALPLPAQRDDEAARAIAQRNALITRLVRERRGAEHARLFLPEAAYLTYYTPTLRGSDAITAYFVEHERPGPVAIDSIDIRSDALHALDGGRWQLEEGAYRVGWRAGGDQGIVEGKSLNLWTTQQDGQWMLFRQAVNHD